jgi:hypothetical protein
MINVVTSNEESFSTIDELEKWVAEEEASLSRLSIGGLLDQGARIVNDEFFGDKSYPLIFTVEGLRALCQSLGFPMIALEMTQEKGLASKVLNDILIQQVKQLGNFEFVVNSDTSNKTNKICGIVSKNYTMYSNYAFLNDININMAKNAYHSSSGFEFEEAYSINTKTYIRYKSTHIAGMIYGKGGIADDKTMLGLEFSNSLVGDSAVSINYFLLRLVCANGLVLPSGNDTLARVIHTGKKNDFQNRINRIFVTALDGIEEKKHYIENLSLIDFKPKKLAELELSELIFDIIPRSKSTIIDNERQQFQCFNFRKLRNEERLHREEIAIRLLPVYFSGPLSRAVFQSKYRDNASMFDLINLFTEYAKTQPAPEKLAIQKRAGDLAEWVVKNQKKF